MSIQRRSVPRLNVTLGNDLMDRVVEVREVTGLSTDTDAARYLIARGIESMSPQLNNLRLMKRLEAQYSPQEMLHFAQQLEGTQKNE